MSGHGASEGVGAEEEGDNWFRSVWDGDGDQDAGAVPPWAPPATMRAPCIPTVGMGWDRDPRTLASLLGPALAATDALARLDARAGAVSEPVREGLIRRLALHEAAGWLAAQAA